MKKETGMKFLAALCAVCMISASSCGNSETESSSDSSSASNTAGDGQFVTDAGDEDLGEYTLSEIGTKLYYDPDQVSAELMAALEKYFIAFSQHDYDTYTESLYPDYITEMNEYLAEDYGYDLETSFENQCDNLETNADGEFTVTRIKAEPSEEDGSEDYMTTLDEIFETDFYESVKNNTDEIYDLMFYVIVDTSDGEMLLISEYEIVFAEKDGKFYAFG